MSARLCGALAITLALWQCGESEAMRRASVYNELRTLVDHEKPPGTFQRTKAMFILTETGCMSCNRSFGQLIARHVNDSSVIFIVDATGQKLDISPFLEDDQRVIWDYEGRFNKLELLDGSGALFLAGDRIDTIIPITAPSLMQQLIYVEGRMEAQ